MEVHGELSAKNKLCWLSLPFSHPVRERERFVTSVRNALLTLLLYPGFK
jgi:hypothetical protein